MDQEHDTPSFSALRRWGAWVNVCVAVVAALALVVMVNYLAARYFKRIPWTPVNAIELSHPTKQVLRGLTNDVQVIVFFDTDESLYSPVKSLLKEYADASRRRVRVETVDYVRNPGRAGEIKRKYNLAQHSEKDLVIFDCEGRTKVVHSPELSDYDVAALMTGKATEVKRKAFKGEPLFTSAILNVSSARQPRAYFVFGHGEHDPANDKSEIGYSAFGEVLRLANVSIAPLSLLGTNMVPADCELLIIAGAREPFADLELVKVDKYLGQGGRLLLLFLPMSQTGLEQLAARWGIEAGQNVVIEPNQTTGGRDVVVMRYGNHPIVKPLAQGQLSMQLLTPRSVAAASKTPAQADAPDVVELIYTSDEATAYNDIRNGEIRRNPFRDYTGTIPLAAAVEKGKVPGVGVGGARLVVCGDSQFLGNQMMKSPANRDFAELAVNWLLDRSQLLGGIGARPVVEYKITVTQGQMRSIRWVLMGALPGAVLFFGLLVWWRRRH